MSDERVWTNLEPATTLRGKRESWIPTKPKKLEPLPQSHINHQLLTKSRIVSERYDSMKKWNQRRKITCGGSWIVARENKLRTYQWHQHILLTIEPYKQIDQANRHRIKIGFSVLDRLVGVPTTGKTLTEPANKGGFSAITITKNKSP